MVLGLLIGNSTWMDPSYIVLEWNQFRTWVWIFKYCYNILIKKIVNISGPTVELKVTQTIWPVRCLLKSGVPKKPTRQYNPTIFNQSQTGRLNRKLQTDQSHLQHFLTSSKPINNHHVTSYTLNSLHSWRGDLWFAVD